MSRLVNFHMHSHHSDGVKSVPQLVDIMKKNGVSWFALTDHDSAEGVSKAQRLAREAGIFCVSGVELSVPLSGCPHIFIEEGDHIHLLAYDFVDEAFHKARYPRSPKEAFDSIRRSGGLSFWAHPYHLYQRGHKKHLSEAQAADLAAWLKKEGMDGMEAYYYDFSPQRRAQLAAVADSLSLIKGVGTDYHGWEGRDKPGLEAPEEPLILLDILKDRRNRG